MIKGQTSSRRKGRLRKRRAKICVDNLLTQISVAYAEDNAILVADNMFPAKVLEKEQTDA